MPEIIDPQGNAESEILYEKYTTATDLYPDFLNIFGGNRRTFELAPDKDEYAGKSYFFKVILREAGSNAMGNQYTFQVFVEEDEDAINNNGTNILPPIDTGGNDNANNGSSSGT